MISDCVDIPLSEEVIVGVVALCPIPSEVDFMWFSALRLVYKLYLFERGVVYSSCICLNSQWRFPVWEVLCGRYNENPSM